MGRIDGKEEKGRERAEGKFGLDLAEDLPGRVWDKHWRSQKAAGIILRGDEGGRARAILRVHYHEVPAIVNQCSHGMEVRW